MKIIGTDFLIFNDGCFGLHSHPDQFEFHYLLGPQGRFHNAGHDTIVERNCLVFSKPYEEHAFYSFENRAQPIYFLRFRPETLEDEKLIAEAGKVFGQKPKYIPQFQDSFQQIRNHAHGQGIHAKKAAECGLMMVLHSVVAGNFGSEEDLNYSAIQDAIHLLNGAVEKDISFETVVKRTRMSAPAFSRLFKRKTGHTVLGYLRERRLEAARFYLETTHDAIFQIATRLQFCDEFHFSKTYKSWSGLSPRQYRASIENKKGEAKDSKS